MSKKTSTKAVHVIAILVCLLAIVFWKRFTDMMQIIDSLATGDRVIRWRQQ